MTIKRFYLIISALVLVAGAWAQNTAREAMQGILKEPVDID